MSLARILEQYTWTAIHGEAQEAFPRKKGVQLCGTQRGKKLHSRIFAASSGASRSYTGAVSPAKSCTLGFLVLQVVLHEPKVAVSDSNEAPSEARAGDNPRLQVFTHEAPLEAPKIRECNFLLVRHDFEAPLEAPKIRECNFLLVRHDFEAPLEAPEIRERNFLPRCVPHNWTPSFSRKCL